MAYPQDGRFYSMLNYDLPDDVLYTQYRLVIPAELAEALGAGHEDWTIPFELKQIEMLHPEEIGDAGTTTPESALPGGSTAAASTQQPAGEVYQPTLAPAKENEINILLTTWL